MKRELKYVRCPTEYFCRLPFAKTYSPAGFSLIELLAVAAILLLLLVLYWGPSTSGNRQREAQKECQDHLQKIYIAMNIYATDHAGKFPEAAGARTSAEALDALVPRYTVDTAVFICPGDEGCPAAGGRVVPAAQDQLCLLHGPSRGGFAAGVDERPAGGRPIQKRPANMPFPAPASRRATTTTSWGATFCSAMAAPNQLRPVCPFPWL